MASYNFPTLNLGPALNAKAALVDSNTPALELNLLTRTGLSFDFTGASWDSAGLFPLYDSALEGSLLGAKGANQYFDNTLYITGKEYYALQSINTPTAAAELNGSNKAFFAGGSVDAISSDSCDFGLHCFFALPHQLTLRVAHSAFCLRTAHTITS